MIKTKRLLRGGLETDEHGHKYKTGDQITRENFVVETIREGFPDHFETHALGVWANASIRLYSM